MNDLIAFDELLQRRHSCRAFRPEPVPREMIARPRRQRQTHSDVGGDARISRRGAQGHGGPEGKPSRDQGRAAQRRPRITGLFHRVT